MKDRITLGVVVTSLWIDLEEETINQTVKKLSKFFDVKLYLPKCKPDEFGSIPLDLRIELLNKASKECGVLLSYCGGFNQIELLLELQQLKFKGSNTFVGQSDNTILVNALTKKGVCKSLYGKGFYDMAKDLNMAEQMARELYEGLTKLKIKPSALKVLQAGVMEGTLVGGNNYTFDLLQGTEFMPDLSKPFVLFMEGEDLFKDSKEVWIDFIRNIDSVMLQKGAIENLRGLIIGKFPGSVAIKKEYWSKFTEDRDYLKGVPIIYDYPCGHNKESFKYLPIGKEVQIKC
ncbi:MAG: muramoyltetrapeptide carboxypeptidase [Patescibacteria group bacterium]|nr:muramoyltetrapeptide carboxypeptidase [Patescibacteria group bacterium]